MIALFTIIITALLFLNYSREIYLNLVGTSSDEFYWISSGKTAQVLLTGDVHNPLWHEEWGFTNFNGAKLVHGAGLMLLGHNNFDVFGHGGQTYYDWLDFSSKPFPQNNPNYSIIRDVRYISAFWTSIAIGMLFVLSVVISGSTIVDFMGSILIYKHPIITNIATYAVSDGILFTCEIITLLLFLHLTQNTYKKKIFWLPMIIGLFLGIGISIKISFAILYLNVMIFLILYRYFAPPESINIKPRPIFYSGAFMTINILVTFLLLNPNILFYREYTFMQLLADRKNITHHHMSIFRKIPGHVLLTLPERLYSFKENTFTFSNTLLFITGIGFSVKDFFFSKRKFLRLFYGIFMLFGLMVLYEMLLYIPFNESHYYLPILPFFMLISTYYLKFIFDIKNISMHKKNYTHQKTFMQIIVTPI